MEVYIRLVTSVYFYMQMATKKKNVADEAALVLQAKLRQASPST